MMRLHLHLLSDSTGETLENIAKAALAQYDDVETVRHFWPMVRTEAHLERILQEIAQNPGLVIFTLVNVATRRILEQRCLALGLPAVAPLDPVNDALSGLLGQQAKARPGSLNYASAGIGGTQHLSGELFKSMAGLYVTHIPYRGSGPAQADFLGNQVPLMVDSVTAALPNIQSGRAVPLAVTSATGEVLEGLVDHSMLRRRTAPDGATRLGMLEPVREYAAEWLDVVDQLWAKGRLTHHGRFFDLDDCVSQPRPQREPRPPVVCAYCLAALFGGAGVEWKHPSQHAPRKEARSSLDPRPPSVNTCNDKE